MTCRFDELYAEGVCRVQACAGNAGALARIERGARRSVNVKKNCMTALIMTKQATERLRRCAGEGARAPSNKSRLPFLILAMFGTKPRAAEWPILRPLT